MRNTPAALLILTMAGAMSFSAYSGDGDKPREKREGDRPRENREGDGPRDGDLLKKFDTDGDGKLSEEEKAAAKKFMEERRRDGDGPPRLSPNRHGPGNRNADEFLSAGPKGQ